MQSRPRPRGLNGTGLEIEQSLDLTQARIGGPLNLEGVRIAKRFLATGIQVDGGDTAIAADLIRIGGNWELMSARLVGQIRMPGADIAGQFRMTATKLFGSSLALRGDGARIGGGAFFSRATIVGTVRFPAAVIENQFRFSGATIKVDDGVAIQAQGARFRRDVELNAGFQTIGGILLDQAEINGSLDLTQSRIKSFAIADARTARRTRNPSAAARRTKPAPRSRTSPSASSMPGSTASRCPSAPTNAPAVSLIFPAHMSAPLSTGPRPGRHRQAPRRAQPQPRRRIIWSSTASSTNTSKIPRACR